MDVRDRVDVTNDFGMGPFERRTTPPPPAVTTERTSWIPAPPERQSWPPPAPHERQSWPPPASSAERPSVVPPPSQSSDRHTFAIPPATDRASLALLSSDRNIGPPGSESRTTLRMSRTTLAPRGGNIAPAVPERSAPLAGERQWYTELPLRPGEGPFQIKGLAHRGLLQYCQQRVDGGIRAFSAALPSSALRDFFSQPFLAGSFYDLLPLAAGSAVAADMTHLSLEAFAQQQGRAQAMHDVQNAYRALLQGRTSDDFHLRLRPLASRYYNFGEWDVLREEPLRLRISCRGIPSWLMIWFTPMLSGYFAGLVAAMGKPHSQVVVASSRREGSAAGIHLSNLDLDILLRD